MARSEATQPALLLGVAAGVAAPLLYATTVLWGATLVPGYSHIRDFISTLTASGMAGTTPVAVLFGLYNLLVLTFAVSALSLTRGDRNWMTSLRMLLIVALCGLLMELFPQDAVGTAVTAAGMAHIALAAFASLGSIGTMLFGALGWRQSPAGADLAIFSFACLALVFLSGLAAALAAPLGWPLAGLLERMTIGTFLLWLLVAAVTMLRELVSLPRFVAHGQNRH